MDILIIVALIIGAILLLLVELFLIPGTSLMGLLGIGCFVAANYYAFTHAGNVAGGITLAVSILSCAGSLVWFMRSKTLDRIALKKSITSHVDHAAQESVKTGDTGVTTTRLALIGYADFDGNIVEVKSEDGFLDEKTPVVVTRITDGILFVQRRKDE